MGPASAERYLAERCLADRYRGEVPELPDVVVYLEALQRQVLGQTIEGIRIKGISALRSFDPPISEVEGRPIIGFRRLGKRLVFELGDAPGSVEDVEDVDASDSDRDDALFLVIHLMVAGRLFWQDPGAKLNKIGVAAFDFADGTLVLNEAASKKRARIWVVKGEEQLTEDHDRGGLEPLEISEPEFIERITARNRTVKRALTDPTIFSGIGNSFSDEILLHAQLSPVKRTQSLDNETLGRLYRSTQKTLLEWLDRLRDEAGDGFPKKVTAFRPEMIVHGKFGEDCTVCGTTVQRISYAANEVNYCPRCQNEGKILADRSLSRLLKDDWPKTVEEFEAEMG